MKRNIYIVGLMMLAAACVKKPVPEAPGTNNSAMADLAVVIDHVAADKKLVLDSVWYQTPNNDSVLFTKFNYFLSNFCFITAEGEERFIEDSYYLVIEQSPESKTFTIKNIPPGAYKQVRFLIGVDSARNVSGAQTGALDPLSGMFWDWNTGYIMMMVEGKSPQSDMGFFGYHVAGFKGENKALRHVTLSFGKEISFSSSKVNKMHLVSDIMQLFHSPHKIYIQKVPFIVEENADAKAMADNYTNMFSIDHVE